MAGRPARFYDGAMKALAISIPVRYFSKLVDWLEEGGTPCRDALSDAQLRALADPQSKLTLAGVDGLIGDLARITGRGDLAYEGGRLIQLSSHDVLGYAIMSCPTIDHILRLVCRYYPLMTPLFELRYQRRGRHAELQFLPAAAMPQQTLYFYMQLQAIAFCMQIGQLAGNRQPRFDVAMGMPAPAHLARYRELPLACFQFGAPGSGVRIRIDAGLFDQPLPMMDFAALEVAEAQCRELMRQFDAKGQWSDWVAMMLRHAEDCQPTQCELAKLLNISARTLDRSLAGEGVRFRALALRIRNERACELLAEGRQGVSQIAYRLGYTDIANFSRSFKRLNGVSPSAYKELVRSA